LTLVLLALALAGCGGSDNGSAEQSEPPPPSATTPDCPPLDGAALTARKSAQLGKGDPVYLTDVSTEAEECTDRVVFDFKESAAGPGYEIRYRPEQEAKTEDATGNPLAIAGSAFLVLRLYPAMTAEINGEDVTPTYTGPRSIAPADTKVVREIVKTGDFEAVVTWAIGIDKKRPFTVTSTKSQLVVEIGSS
jgi:hypothetical protein